MTLAITLINVRAPDATRGPQTAAEVLVEEMRAARSRAISNGVPVGFALPGKDCSSQSFYLLEGHVFPRIVKVKDLSNEYARTYLSMAAWSEAGSLTVDQPETPGEEFLIGAWKPPFPEDPTIIFLPSGKVVSNGLPRAGQRYLMLLSSGVELRDATVSGDPEVSPSAATKLLRAASNPHTISVTVDGDIELIAGIFNNPSAKVESAPIPTVVAPPNMSPAPTQQPEIISVEPYAKSPLSPEGEVLVPLNGYLTLEVEAWSPSGAPLFLEWSGPGQFTVTEASPMEWHPQEGVWRLRVDWHPRSILAGDTVDLTARVSDRYGNRNAAVDAGQLSVRVDGRKGQIVNTGIATYPLLCLEDGSSETDLQEEAGWTHATWSPDGSTIAAVKGQKLALIVPGVGVVKTLIEEPRGVTYPTWSPDGTKLLYYSWTEVVVINVDGTGRRNLLDSGSRQPFGGFSWKADSKTIAYASITHGWQYRMNTIKTNGTGHQVVASHPNKYLLWPSWSADGSKLAFFDYSSNEIQVRNGASLGTSAGTIPLTGMNGWGSGIFSNKLNWSPDGSTLGFEGTFNGQTGADVNLIDVASGNITPIQDSIALHYTPGIWSPDENQLLYSKGGEYDPELGDRLFEGISRHDLATGINESVIPGAGYGYGISIDWTR
jgi:WD40-like Beta Propeller Repeat